MKTAKKEFCLERTMGEVAAAELRAAVAAAGSGVHLELGDGEALQG